jgi:hypothetical protein
MDPHLVITTLVDRGVIAADQADTLIQSIVESGRPPEDFLIEEGHVDEHTFYQTIADSIGANYIDLTDFVLEDTLRDRMPVSRALLHRALPVADHEGTLFVALSDPLNAENIAELRFALTQNFQVSVAPTRRIEELIE